MATKNDLSRITIDISRDDHKRLKAISAVLGKSMRVVVIEALEEYLYKTNSTNSDALSTVKDIEKDKKFLNRMNLQAKQ